MGPLVRPFSHFARRTSKIFRPASYFVVNTLCSASAPSLAPGPCVPLDERLSLIDGLALHSAIQPGRTTPARIRQLLRHHLETLLA